MQTASPCVRIVEDEPDIRKLLSLLVEAGGFSSRAYESAERFISEDNLSEPGCILIDLKLPVMSGVELFHWIRSQPIPLPTIIVTGHGTIAKAVQCLKGGAADFIEKPIDSVELISLVLRAVAIDANQRATRESMADVAERYESLSLRQKQVMVCLSQGLSSKQIASRMGVTTKTVEKHRGLVMQKMHAVSLAEVVRAALELNLSTGPT